MRQCHTSLSPRARLHTAIVSLRQHWPWFCTRVLLASYYAGLDTNVVLDPRISKGHWPASARVCFGINKSSKGHFWPEWQCMWNGNIGRNAHARAYAVEGGHNCICKSAVRGLMPNVHHGSTTTSFRRVKIILPQIVQRLLMITHASMHKHQLASVE